MEDWNNGELEKYTKNHSIFPIFQKINYSDNIVIQLLTST